LSGGGLATYVGSTPTEAMRITSAGYVGIGTASPNYKLEVSGNGTGVNSRIGVTNTATGSTTEFGNDANGGFMATSGAFNNLFYTNGTERMRVKSTGAVVVGKTTESGMATGSSVNMGICLNDSGNPGILTIQENTDANMYFSKASGYSSGIYVRFYVTGTQVGKIESNGSSTSYVTSSDYRLKENIAPMTGALAKVALLKPVTYKWKDNGSASEGFIAHELQEVCPDAVSGEKDAVNKDGDIEPQGVDTSFLVATLTAAIQEQQAIIENLKSRIEVLEAK
jgi:hypothetical protein